MVQQFRAYLNLHLHQQYYVLLKGFLCSCSFWSSTTWSIFNACTTLTYRWSKQTILSLQYTRFFPTLKNLRYVEFKRKQTDRSSNMFI